MQPHKKHLLNYSLESLLKSSTPLVVFLAVAICVLPMLFVNDYVFRDWLYRALVFLVISCPCALALSVFR